MRYLQTVRAAVRRNSRAVLRFLSEEIGVDLLGSRVARRKILRRIDECKDRYSEQVEALRSVADGLTLSDLDRYANLETDRRKSIDDKAKTYFAAMTIAVTVLFAGLNFLSTRLSGHWKTAAVILLMAGVVYLLVGGLNAFYALTIRSLYRPSPEDESGLPAGARKRKILWCMKQNEMSTILQTNALSVAHKSIRNGVIILGMLTLLLACRILFGSSAALTTPVCPSGSSTSGVALDRIALRHFDEKRYAPIESAPARIFHPCSGFLAGALPIES